MGKRICCIHVAVNVVDYFESKIRERMDRVKVLSKKDDISENNEPVITYILEVEDGVINPEYIS